jgi:hypothetical protein
MSNPNVIFNERLALTPTCSAIIRATHDDASVSVTLDLFNPTEPRELIRSQLPPASVALLAQVLEAACGAVALHEKIGAANAAHGKIT